MPISHDIVNLKGKSTLSSCSEWNKFLKRVSGSTKECATEAQTLNHNLVNISFFKIDELGLVGKCVKHAFRIYMGCYLQFCITKKLRSVNKNLSKVHFFHILSAHAKGLKALPIHAAHALFSQSLSVLPGSVGHQEKANTNHHQEYCHHPRKDDGGLKIIYEQV